MHWSNNSWYIVLYITISIYRLHEQLNYRFMRDGVLIKWNNLISITNLGLNLSIAATDLFLNKGSSPLEFVFLNFNRSCWVWDFYETNFFFWFLREWDFSWLQILKCNETETFQRLQSSGFQDQDTATIIKTQTFPRLEDLCDYLLKWQLSSILFFTDKPVLQLHFCFVIAAILINKIVNWTVNFQWRIAKTWVISEHR